MILILLRIRANIPVIMMGETGCGKTSLIRMIKELKNNAMYILNIHAGIVDKDIINFMTERGLLESQHVFIDKVWVFLDEINTCNSMGLIAEMMCNHTMNGVRISEHVVFIAACNPYRLVTKADIEVGLTKKKESKIRNLVYSVNPLPFSLLNYVFDFGNLQEKDEEKYIERIVTGNIQKFNNEKELIDIAKRSVIIAQNYVRERNDISSVSLREVRRFGILLEWFVSYLKKKKDIDDSIQRKYRKKLSDREIIQRAITLSIILCYYLRLPVKSQRKTLKEKLINILDDIAQVADEEMNELADRVHLPPGIAKNQALLENIFTLFVCINTKIPVFIVGKPGCSKSLSVQLIYKSMKGSDSDDPFFRKFPKLYMNAYQGSLTSTSKGILKVFEKARLLVKNANNSEVISMFYFDEMGLAEISENRPLKVIHSQLEYDDNLYKVAFVGISNWKLDASKMNRGISISILDEEEEDLIKTAHIIADSYQKRISVIYSNLLDALSKAYFNYKAMLSQMHPENKEFHGSRDFYHLIKYFFIITTFISFIIIPYIIMCIFNNTSNHIDYKT